MDQKARWARRWGWGVKHLGGWGEHWRIGKSALIESKHLNLRTQMKRLVRRTICFAKTEHMHDLVIGLFINRYEFGRSI